MTLNQYYGQSHTLWDLDLDVPEGQCTVLMGRNGVGKTTLLAMHHGAAAGEIRQPCTTAARTSRQVAAERRAALGLGYVPQGRQIFPLLTVEENLLIGLPARRDGLRKVPDFIYEMFPVLKEMLGRRGGDLSGGQQQQLAIGRALVTDPQAADPGRAHRGHPAQHRRRDRQHRSQAQPGDGPDRAAGRTKAAVCAQTGRSFLSS